MTHCVIDENLASITAGEAMLHCVRNNNMNLNDSILIDGCFGDEFRA